MDNERAVKMAAKLYECRDAARRLLGDGYGPRMAELGTALTRVATARGCGVLAAATECARDVDGMSQIQILAAAVELTEPSTVPA